MISSFIVYQYIWGSESIGVKGFQPVHAGFKLVDLSHWHLSFDVAAHAFCACGASKVKVFCSWSVNLGVHMFGLLDQVAIFFQF